MQLIVATMESLQTLSPVYDSRNFRVFVLRLLEESGCTKEQSGHFTGTSSHFKEMRTVLYRIFLRLTIEKPQRSRQTVDVCDFRWDVRLPHVDLAPPKT